MSKRVCEVCEGGGWYPIITSSGRELYDIKCPECYGSGEAADDEDDEDAECQFEYPASTAANIRDVGEMQRIINKHWR